jgi:hypothetical protein
MVFVGWEVHGITSAVVPFVVGVNNLGSVGKKWNFVQQFITANAVLAHDCGFVRRQGPGFRRMRSGIAIFPTSWKTRSASNRVYMLARQAHGTGDANCEHRHSLRRSFDLVTLEAKRFRLKLQA